MCGRPQLADEHGDRWPVVAPLRTGVGDDPVRVDDEIAAELQGVATKRTQSLTASHECRVPGPDTRIEPHARAARPPEAPISVGDTLPVDENRVRHVETVEEPATENRRVVVDDEQSRRAETIQFGLLAQHLHEVRTADQSAGVPEEAHQHRPATVVVEPDCLARESRELEPR